MSRSMPLTPTTWPLCVSVCTNQLPWWRSIWPCKIASRSLELVEALLEHRVGGADREVLHLTLVLLAHRPLRFRRLLALHVARDPPGALADGAHQAVVDGELGLRGDVRAEQLVEAVHGDRAGAVVGVGLVDALLDLVLLRPLREPRVLLEVAAELPAFGLVVKLLHDVHLAAVLGAFPGELARVEPHPLPPLAGVQVLDLGADAGQQHRDRLPPRRLRAGVACLQIRSAFSAFLFACQASRFAAIRILALPLQAVALNPLDPAASADERRPSCAASRRPRVPVQASARFSSSS